MEIEATSTIASDERSGMGWPVLNWSDLADEDVVASSSLREIASRLSRWVDNARAAAGRTSMFDRGAYTPPDNPYDEMRAARHAMRYDDIVSGVHEITESFAFQGVKWEGENSDDADILNQVSRDLNLDMVIRSMWWEEYAVSQFAVAMQWGWRNYKIRGKTRRGNAKKAQRLVYVPIAMSVLDTTKVVPVMHGALGTGGLAWSSTNDDIEHFSRVLRGEVIDPEMLQFYLGHYKPEAQEEGELSRLGVDTKNLMLLNPQYVFRHTATKPDYMRFAPVRLRSVFSLLDLKRQLIHSDRAALIGSANYILLVKKGDSDIPAKPAEIRNLRENYNFIAKMPVIISDHRLNIEIIAPKVDFTLDPDKYNTIDNRILSRLLGTLTISQQGQRNETNITLARAVAKSMENRRHMIRRTLEQRIARAVVQHPLNAGKFDSEPNLVFVPRSITLDVDAALIQALLNLRTQQEISRETILEYFGLDQETEAQRREMERERYDDIFQTIVPYSGAQPGSPQANGAQGGRPVGGGDGSRDSTKVSNKTESGNPSTATD